MTICSMRNTGADLIDPISTTNSRSLPIEPLLSAEGSETHGIARRHAHYCAACANLYECPGLDEMGYCAPVCEPCCWIELGSQLRIYQEMVTELERKRRSIECRIGKDACDSAKTRRRDAQDHGLVIAFGNVFKLPRDIQVSAQDTSFCAQEAQGAASHGK